MASEVRIKIAAMIIAVFIIGLSVIGCTRQEEIPIEIAENDVLEEPNIQEKIKLVYAVHWMDKTQLDGIYEDGRLKSKGLKQYLNEYTGLHPEIEFEILSIPYGEYAAKLELLHEIDSVPDIYQIYSSWGVLYAELGMLDELPQDLKEDVIQNYVSTAGVTINGEIRGIPTEINDFALLYNKALFREAGVVDEEGNAKYPETWEELVDAAVKTTKKDENGNIAQYGYAFLKGMDWGVVDPFLSLLFSNEGDYISEDYAQCLLNSSEGIEALEAILELFDNGATDANSNVFDFGKGNAVMIIAAPWMEAMFRETIGDEFDTVVGVAPVPYLKKSASLQYSWFMGVMGKSKHKEEAWDFLRWFTSEIQPDRKTTRYGDLLARTI
ncbi:MAG: sugar ABC transporter substrate-binding protein, partial [Thermodesulfovibrionia bacterium]|nr:sugar ABC transporter substrate-binding protein [Thermodesulfovibrionia bacterium]